MSPRRLRWLAFASYLLVAALVVGPTTLLRQGEVAGVGVDLPGTVWMHWWIGTTVEHLSLPLTSDLLFYPDGKNFFNDTGANFLDAYLGVPLQWMFGVPDFLDWLDVLVLVGNALAMYALATDLTGGRHMAAAWAAGVAFELNPYGVQQLAEGRPTQALLWFAVLATRHLLRIPTGTWRDGAWFGLFTVLQGLTYWFMVYFLTWALLPVALVLLLRNPRVVAPRLAVALGVALAIAAPFLLAIASQIDAGNVHRLGAASWSEGPAATPTRWRITVEQHVQATTLVGVALGLYAWRRTWPWLVGVALVAVFAAGAQLDVTDPPLRNSVFVWLFEHVPLVPRLGFPERVLSMGFVLLGMCAAAGLARLDAVWAVLLVAVSLSEGVWRDTYPLPTSGMGVPRGNLVIKEQGGPVIFLPFSANEDAMIYQTVHGQPLFGGMGERESDLRPAGYQQRLDNGFVRMLAGSLNDTEAPVAYTRAERGEITTLFRWVWFDRRFVPPSWTALGYDLDGKYRRLVAELGEPTASGEGWALFDLRLPTPEAAPGLGPSAVERPDAITRLEHAALAPVLGGRRPAKRLPASAESKD